MNRWMRPIIASALLLAPLVALAEPHPVIQQAKREINHALFLLQHRAARDFGGHKMAAIRLLMRARAQLNASEAYDSRERR